MQPLFQLYKIVSDYREKFQIENFSEIYKYFQKSISEQICSVPNRNTLQMALQIFNKLPVSLNIIQSYDNFILYMNFRTQNTKRERKRSV